MGKGTELCREKGFIWVGLAEGKRFVFNKKAGPQALKRKKIKKECGEEARLKSCLLRQKTYELCTVRS